MIAIFATLYSGFEHAFETDHLLAVNSIVSNRNNLKHSIKDGMFWGLGHTATILIVGMLVFTFKLSINENLFQYFEALVGVMLMVLGCTRLYYFMKYRREGSHSSHYLVDHFTAFKIGLAHGLSGSGAIMIVILSQLNTIAQGVFYIVIFGIGSIAGMLMASSLFSFSFTKSLLMSKKLQTSLIVISSLLCFFFGAHVLYTNLVL